MTTSTKSLNNYKEAEMSSIFTMQISKSVKNT